MNINGTTAPVCGAEKSKVISAAQNVTPICSSRNNLFECARLRWERFCNWMYVASLCYNCVSMNAKLLIFYSFAHCSDQFYCRKNQKLFSRQGIYLRAPISLVRR